MVTKADGQRGADSGELTLLASDACLLVATTDESDGVVEGIYVPALTLKPEAMAG